MWMRLLNPALLLRNIMTPGPTDQRESAEFFTARGWAVFANELLWVWIPTVALLGVTLLLQCQRPRSSEPASTSSA